MSSPDPMEAIRATFFQECEEQLAELETGLLALQGDEGDADTLNAVFRAVHSIKGGAGAFGLEALVRFAHTMESLLEEMRGGRVEPSAPVLQALLRSADLLADLVRAARDGDGIAPDRAEALAADLDALGAGWLETDGADDDAFDGFEVLPVCIALDADAGLQRQGFRIVFRPRASLYGRANEPALILRELARLGALTVTLDASALPDLEMLEPEGAYLGWTAELVTEADAAAVGEAFAWVEDDCELSIDALEAAPPEAPDTQGWALPALVTAPDLDVAALLARLQPAEVPSPRALAANDPPEAAPAPRTAAADDRNAGSGATIRVDLERLDKLIDLVGELVINNAMLAQRLSQQADARPARSHQADTVGAALESLEHLIHDIQEGVMAIRAQPVRAVFQRMPRLVRELAATLGKDVRLVSEGEGCEVDRTVIERLADPLIHMVRNAVDHGLEPAAARLAVGKPAEGTIRISAAHRSGRVVIEVADDGRGIDRPRVRALAEARGIVQPGVALSDDEIDNLIFAPGFSTAEAVSDVSGRGVGMDVVRRQVHALGGRIGIASHPGRGSTFTLSLPLTLAVLDGMVVEAAGQTLVVPLGAIVETLQPRPGQVRRLGPDASLLAIRDTHVPVLDVGEALGFRASGAEPSQAIAVLVEDDQGARSALLVDAIHGQRQVVIKSLEANYGRVPGVAAATILGDGRVALILDVAALNALHRTPAPDRQPRVA